MKQQKRSYYFFFMFSRAAQMLDDPFMGDNPVFLGGVYLRDKDLDVRDNKRRPSRRRLSV